MRQAIITATLTPVDMVFSSASAATTSRSIPDRRSVFECSHDVGRLMELADVLEHKVWSTRADGFQDYSNARWAEYTGSRRDPVSGDEWVEFVHPEDRAHVRDSWRRSIITGEPFEAEYRLRRRDGIYRWHLSRGAPHRDSAGTIVRWCGTSTDIDDMRTTAAALRESQARFREIAESIGEVFWLADSASRPLYVSPAYEAIWGRSVESLYSNPREFLATVHPDDRECVIGWMSNIEIPFDGECRIVRPDGAIRYIHARGFPVRDASGKVVRVAGVAEDATARRELEEQFRQAQKMEAIGRLAGGMAHDFNNILTVISAHSEFLAAGGVPAESEGDLREIIQATRRAATLTRQLLAFSRRQVLEKTIVNPNEVVGELEKMLSRLIGEDVELTIELDPRAPLIVADAGQIEQALMNLAVNARDAMPDGGRLHVSTRRALIDDRHAVDESLGAPGAYVAISVADSGTGMTPEVRAHVFEPFFTTKDRGRGTGLGLSMVYGFARQSGGFVTLATAPGHGSTFTMFLPASPDQIVSPAPESVRELAPAAATGTVLIVEDRADLREVLRRILEMRGYEVVDARDGDEAFEAIQAATTPFDIVITDAVMPRMSGPQLVEKLVHVGCTVPIVLISGYWVDDGAWTDAVAERVTFLNKPFTGQRLLTAVREAVAGAGANGVNSSAARRCPPGPGRGTGRTDPA